MIVELDHADQNTTRALWVYKRMTTPRVAEGVSYDLAAGLDDLIASIVQILNLKADVVKAGAPRCEEIGRASCRERV